MEKGEGSKRINQEVGRRWIREREKSEGNKRFNQEVGRGGIRGKGEGRRKLGNMEQGQEQSP
jgi:hypothetical protein